MHTLLLPLPQPAQLRQLLHLIGGTSPGVRGQCAVDFQQLLLILGQDGRVLLRGQTQQIIRGNVQITTDLANEIQTHPAPAAEIIVK